ncbi:hypothetical protein [Trichothermofontia sp.]
MISKVIFCSGFALFICLLNSASSTIAQAQSSSPRVTCYPTGCVAKRPRTGNSSDLRIVDVKLDEEGAQPTLVWTGLQGAHAYSITLFEITQSEPLAVVTQPATAFTNNEESNSGYSNTELSYPLPEILTIGKQYKIVLGAQVLENHRVKVVTDEMIFEVIPEHDRPSSPRNRDAT